MKQQARAGGIQAGPARNNSIPAVRIARFRRYRQAVRAGWM